MERVVAPADVWIDTRVVARRSTIEGWGLFADADISGGDVVLRLGGRLVSAAELMELISAADEDPDAPYVDTITVDEDVHLVLPPGTLAHFVNHGCDPTLWHVGAFDLVARRDIGRGEELTVDYRTHSGAAAFTMSCNCGHPTCRGRISSDDWRDVNLQARYRGHWVPALEERIQGAPQSRRRP